MTDKSKAERITLTVSEETMEQIAFLAESEGMSATEMASKLLAEEAEAQASLARGPLLRKYMYR